MNKNKQLGISISDFEKFIDNIVDDVKKGDYELVIASLEFLKKQINDEKMEG